MASEQRNMFYFYPVNLRVSILWLLFSMFFFGCNPANVQEGELDALPGISRNTKPMTRWWWFATDIKPSDVRHQLNWIKSMNFGGVEIAWVYPLHRYQKDYLEHHNRHYPVDESAPRWLSKEWTDIVVFTKRYCDSIGLVCDFTFGSAWPSAASNLPVQYTSKIYGDTSFRRRLTFAWDWPEEQLVIDHLNSNAFKYFSDPITAALRPALSGMSSAFFTDSWELQMNSSKKIWTDGFDSTFLIKFGYDLVPYMKAGLDSFPDVRYDYMMHLGEYVQSGFYEPFVRNCKENTALSRVQCLAAPADIMTLYSLVDIPESEAMLNNPSFSRIVSSSATCASKKLVSCEAFTCMYGFKKTYLRQENIADLKLIADALFAEGINHLVYHGTPYNPKGSDTNEFFASTYFGPGGALESQLPEFNQYVASVSNLMQRGKTFTDIAVYLPYEDAVMKGALPPEKQRVFVWGEYEMRYILPPEELDGYHPIWINREFLEKAEVKDGKLNIGDAQFSALYLDVNYLDLRALKAVLNHARQKLPVFLKGQPIQPAHLKSDVYKALLLELKSLENVSDDLADILDHPPLLQSDTSHSYWCRVMEDGTHLIFISQLLSNDLSYPLYSGQAFMDKSESHRFTFNVNGQRISRTLEFEPYQSLIVKISPSGKFSIVDIEFVPNDPVIRPREMQRLFF